MEHPAPSCCDWKYERKIGEWLYLFYSFQNGRARRKPLYMFKFRFLQKRHLTQEQCFFREHPSPETLTTISDKLRWYRIHAGLCQKELASILGVCRETYSSYESNVLTVYPLDKLQLAADLYHIDITTLLDEYNLFLYHGQGSRLKTIRTSLHMTQSDFAVHIGVPIGTLKNWEKERVRMSKPNYEKLRRFITL